MKIQSINFYNNSLLKKSKNINFNGKTVCVPYTITRNFDEVAENLIALSKAKYYEALDDKIYSQNKIIRQKNFSFLSNLVKTDQKKCIIEWYKEMTGFPDLKKTSSAIVSEFVKNSERAAQVNNTTIEAIGFDCTSSVGLQKALPGSDLDKAYVILGNKNHYPYLVEDFKGYLWNNINQYIMSLNHQDTFPEVYTTDQIKKKVALIDDVIIKNMDLSPTKQQEYIQNIMFETVPVKAGKFNIELARHLPNNGLTKEEVKNFAYFVEFVRDGYSMKPSIYLESEFLSMMEKSPFLTFSNVTQIRAHDRLLSHGQKSIKTKLRNRESLINEFDKFDIDKQYRFVVDMIKYISEDQSDEFIKYYKNDDNIKERYDTLNRLLLE